MHTILAPENLSRECAQNSFRSPFSRVPAPLDLLSLYDLQVRCAHRLAGGCSSGNSPMCSPPWQASRGARHRRSAGGVYRVRAREEKYPPPCLYPCGIEGLRFGGFSSLLRRFPVPKLSGSSAAFSAALARGSRPLAQ